MKFPFKNLIARLLFSARLGKIVRHLFNNQIPFEGGAVHTNNSAITDRTVAQIFFRGYESSELRFIKKYLKQEYPVVELGSSIGLISRQILAKRPSRLICVEANPHLIPTLKMNLHTAKWPHYHIVNKALHYSGEQLLYFMPGKDNTTGRIINQAQQNTIPISTTSLSQLLQKFSIEQFSLVCDIEGAEISFLKEDTEALAYCHQLIIETHKTSYAGEIYHPADFPPIFADLGFNIIDQYGPNYVLER